MNEVMAHKARATGSRSNRHRRRRRGRRSHHRISMEPKDINLYVARHCLVPRVTFIEAFLFFRKSSYSCNNLYRAHGPANIQDVKMWLNVRAESQL